MEARALEEAEKWRSGVFAVTREVYQQDEALCHAVEQAVWVSNSIVGYNILNFILIFVLFII